MNKKIKFRVNGKRVEGEVPTNRLLIDYLRYDLGLTGTKEGCSVGVCGACTVLMDGDMISSCLTLAVMVDGHDITTVEGLAKNGELNRCKKASSSTAGSSAVSAPRGKSSRRRRCSKKIPNPTRTKSKIG